MQDPAEVRQVVLERLRAHQVSLVYHQAVTKQVISPLTGIIASIVLWPVANQALSLAWIAALVGVSLLRQGLAVLYSRDPHCEERVEVWERRFMMSIGLASAIWGVGAVLQMTQLPRPEHAFLFVFAVGMVGGTLALYNGHPRAVILATAFILGPPILYLLLAPDPQHLAMAFGGMLLCYAVVKGVAAMGGAMLSRFELSYRLEQVARTDSLSGLANRHAFMEIASFEFGRAAEGGPPCAALLLDIDHFKSINDRFGHAAGDAVIREMGALLLEMVRHEGIAARIGGEEFAILLPGADQREAMPLATALLEAVRGLRVGMGTGSLAFTVSAGLADSRGAETLDELLDRADQGLYEAKRAGRDSLRIAGEVGTGLRAAV